MKQYIETERGELSGRVGCDCPAHVHDKELPLELVNTPVNTPLELVNTPVNTPVNMPLELVNTDTGQQGVNYGYSSHFDF